MCMNLQLVSSLSVKGVVPDPQNYCLTWSAFGVLDCQLSRAEGLNLFFVQQKFMLTLENERNFYLTANV